MKVFAAGPLKHTGEIRAKLRDSGNEVHTATRPAVTPEEIGGLVQWVVVNCDGVYMLPLWRSCLVALAIRAAMRAAGKSVGGLE
jgi:hypothetical protein